MKERLRKDIAVWFSDGIIDKNTLDILNQRYDTKRFGWIGVVKYLGITGGLFAFFGIIGFIAVMSQSTVFAAFVLVCMGIGLTYWGLRLADNVQDLYSTSSKVIVTLGMVLWISAIGLLSGALGLKGSSILTITGIISLPVSLLLAYRNHNTYLLILTILGLFHWIGAWNTMWGRSTYVFEIQDPRVMCVAALAAIGTGIYHERILYYQTGGFYKAWESLGLVYLNMSLLILSIWADFKDGNAISWIITFTVSCLAQIILGARFQNGLLRGFGITFFVIDIFTRYHEMFWNSLNLGTYLLYGGVCLVVVGGSMEASLRIFRIKWVKM
jgi:uncharacterized membrane protein